VLLLYICRQARNSEKKSILPLPHLQDRVQKGCPKKKQKNEKYTTARSSNGIEPSTTSIAVRYFTGGAGNRTQIETGWYDIPLKGTPQRHVLPLHHTTLAELIG
jgi:hypothetical protein